MFPARAPDLTDEPQSDDALQGSQERKATYDPIVEALLQLYDHLSLEERAEIKILVPGAGLGRLAWEIVNAGQ